MESEFNSKEKSYLVLKETLRFIRFVFVLTLMFWVIRSFVMQPFIVRGSSMEDTFSNGDYVIIEKLSYQFNNPQRGDVVVFKAGFTSAAPNDHPFYIKRIVGLPGETVRIRKGEVVIKNQAHPEGRRLKESYLDSDTVTRRRRQTQAVTLEKNEYFVLGDNRPNSSDSRVWGPLKERKIVGKPFLRVYPFDEFLLFSKNTFGKNIDT